MPEKWLKKTLRDELEKNGSPRGTVNNETPYIEAIKNAHTKNIR